MKTVVITGSTRGIGLGLATSFLEQGCRVCISGRSQARVDQTIANLSTNHNPELIRGYPCQVTDPADLQALWDEAKRHFGKIDIWINNAGITQRTQPLWTLATDEIKAVIDVNLLGVMYGSYVAINGMLQQGSGQLYNMEGLGSDSRTVVGMSVYGSSKAAVRYFSKSLLKETADTPVQVCTLSPGMVITDLLIGELKRDPLVFEKSKHLFNILADQVETVTPYLVEKILTNNKSGTHIAWLTTPKIIWRFMTSHFNKRDLFAQS